MIRSLLACSFAFAAISITAKAIPSCDGTMKKFIKCNNGKLPEGQGHEELLACAGEFDGEVSCKIAVAFAKDWHDCTAPKADGGTLPPEYTTYCVDDTTQEVDCMHINECIGVYNATTMKTVCTQNKHTEHKRYPKKLLSELQNECRKVFAAPPLE